MKLQELFKQIKTSNDLKNQLLEPIKIKGRVVNKRSGRNICFLQISDGTTIDDLQAVISDKTNHDLFLKVDKIKRNSIVEITGLIKLTPDRPQPLELKIANVNIINKPLSESPLQNKNHSDEFLRDVAHLRIQGKKFQIISRLKSLCFEWIHEFFKSKNYVYIHTPIITNNDAEGAGETFYITQSQDNDKNSFFGTKAVLTVSGQLHAESYAQALGAVYTFGPTFRAEKSHTTQHVAEFWMLEPECLYMNLKDIMALAQSLMCYMASKMLHHGKLLLKALYKKEVYGELINRLKTITPNNFASIDYISALKILKKASIAGVKFEYNDFEFGDHLQKEHERYLTEIHFKKPCFIYNFPLINKAFYMKANDDQKTVAAFDLLLANVGEIIGGSTREDDYHKLKNRCQALGLNPENFEWYLDLRKYGYAPSAGFGLGFERLFMVLTGVKNIRDTIPFPRIANSLKF